MLGFGDFTVFLGYTLTILSTILCIVYGVINWNKDGDPEELLQMEQQWEKEEHEIDENL